MRRNVLTFFLKKINTKEGRVSFTCNSQGIKKIDREASQLGITEHENKPPDFLTRGKIFNISKKIPGRYISKNGSRLRKMAVVEGSRLNFPYATSTNFLDTTRETATMRSRLQTASLLPPTPHLPNTIQHQFVEPTLHALDVSFKRC
jgi:hypothetical protein